MRTLPFANTSPLRNGSQCSGLPARWARLLTLAQFHFFLLASLRDYTCPPLSLHLHPPCGSRVFHFWQKGASLKAFEASVGAFDRVPLRWSADSLGFVVGPLCESALLRMPRLVTRGHCFQGPFWPRSILAELDTSAPTQPIPAAPVSGSSMGGNGDLPLNCGERMRSGLNCHGGCSAHCGFFTPALCLQRRRGR